MASLIEQFLGGLNEVLAVDPVRTPRSKVSGWEIPPKGPGDSDIIMTRGEADGSHTTVRLQKQSTDSK